RCSNIGQTPDLELRRSHRCDRGPAPCVSGHIRPGAAWLSLREHRVCMRVDSCPEISGYALRLPVFTSWTNISMPQISTIGLVGRGLIGSSWALVFARSGLRVRMWNRGEEE